MIKLLKDTLFNILPQKVINWLQNIHQKRQLNKWHAEGQPVPPPHLVKQQIIANYQKTYDYKIFIETGTYRGDMIHAQSNNFKKLFSIELGKDLFEKARNRFRNFDHIHIVHGDSGKMLPTLMEQINEPAIFWLDGHYSAGVTAQGEKDCPIFEELEAIFTKDMDQHLLLIDDARCFVGEGDYPTIDELTIFIHQKNPKYKVKVEHDIIQYFI